MAAKKPKKSNKVPQTAQEKAARKAMTAAQQVGVEASRARQTATSKGAFRQRQLRAGGSELQRYDQSRFANDPFPTVVVPPSGGYSRGAAAPRAPKAPAPRKAAPKRAAPKKKGAREVTPDLTPGKPTKRIPSTNDGQLANREKRAEEIARKKAEEAKKAAERKKATQKNKDLGTYRAPTRTGQTAM